MINVFTHILQTQISNRLIAYDSAVQNTKKYAHKFI